MVVLGKAGRNFDTAKFRAIDINSLSVNAVLDFPPIAWPVLFHLGDQYEDTMDRQYDEPFTVAHL